MKVSENNAKNNKVKTATRSYINIGYIILLFPVESLRLAEVKVS